MVSTKARFGQTRKVSLSLIATRGYQKRKLAATSSKSNNAGKPQLSVSIPAPSPTLEEEVRCQSNSGSATSEANSLFDEPKLFLSRRTAPPIPGLYFAPSLSLPPELASHVMQQCMDTYFGGDANQIMLFDRAGHASSFPPFLTSLLDTLSDLLRAELPAELHKLLFPAESVRARQAILNLYQPGQGITAHVDLLTRFGDGILDVSLGSGCVMRFDRVIEPGISKNRRWDVYLPAGSVIILSGDSRYKWTHAIDEQLDDFVETADEAIVVDEKIGEYFARDVRLSVTFRWLLPGADSEATQQ